jgi:hypothetical protein
MFGTRLPHYRTASGMFDDMVAGQLKRLGTAWPDLMKPVEFAVEDVPPSMPTPWDDEDRTFSQGFPVQSRHSRTYSAVSHASADADQGRDGNAADDQR